MISVCKKFEFEAAHMLPHYEGCCNNLHGHSYRLEVEVSKTFNGIEIESGMIIDFKDLKAIVQENILDKFDHSYLNHFWANPTAENMVIEFVKILKDKLPLDIQLQRLRLYETTNSYAEWRNDNEN